MHMYWKGISKNLSIRQDYLHRKPKGNYKLLELISKLNKVAGYKIIIEKSIVLVFTSNEQLEVEIKLALQQY